MKKSFTIIYSCYDKNNRLLKQGTIIVKDKFNSFDAQTALENHFKYSITGFYKLLIASCEELTIAEDLTSKMKKFGKGKDDNNFGDLFKTFGDIFNPKIK